MKFIGNYSEWINPVLVEYLLSNNGVSRPNGGENPDCDEFKLAEKVGYDMTKTMWYFYNEKNLPFDIKLPIETNKTILWWFIKMLPGHYMPMHKDPHVTMFDDITNCVRYWMPLQDYEDGHIFVYDKTMISNYKAGDLYVYDDSNAIHGACNIGYTPRLTFLFSTYDSVEEV